MTTTTTACIHEGLLLQAPWHLRIEHLHYHKRFSKLRRQGMRNQHKGVGLKKERKKERKASTLGLLTGKLGWRRRAKLCSSELFSLGDISSSSELGHRRRPTICARLGNP
jgi:hypothetical protein